MITTSGGLISHLVNPTNKKFAPVSKVVYYDTPYSVPSFGFKKVVHHNKRADLTFHDDEIVFVGRDSKIFNSWGKHGPAVIPDGKNYMIQWYAYFYAEYTGTYKFYASSDDGCKIFIPTHANRNNFLPEELTATEELSMNPTDSNFNGSSSWESRDQIVTFSGWASLVAGNWYPIKIHYFNNGTTVDSYGDMIVRYQEPSGSSFSSEKKVLSAGIANYPSETETWADASEASFIDEDMAERYLELPQVESIDGDRGIGKVGLYKVYLPLDQSNYREIKGLRGHYRYKDSPVILRAGRLIDIWAGYQTKCRNYNASTIACSLSLPPLASGGYFQPNLCNHSNPRCPYNQEMPGDLVKRTRGKITKIEQQRERGKSFIVLHCEDNLHYLNSQINENYPNYSSYALFDYENKTWSRSAPDGVQKPVTYDNFLIKEAVMDTFIKAGIDPIYLYKKQKVLTSGFTFVESQFNYIQGDSLRLSRPIRYGNAFKAGDPNDTETDSKYIWTQSFGSQLIDLVSALSEAYGYLFTVDPDGYMVFKTRDNPQLFATSGAQWSVPGDWIGVPASKAFGGDYIFASGSSNELLISGTGSRITAYVALQRLAEGSSWSIIYDQTFQTSGVTSHGDYSISDMQTSSPIDRPMFGVNCVKFDGPGPIGGQLYSTVWYPKGIDSWIMITPMVGVTVDKIQIRLQTPSSLPLYPYNHYVLLDVDIGQFDPTYQSSNTGPPNNTVRVSGYASPAFTGSPTSALSNYGIKHFFTANGPATREIPLSTPVTLASGVKYGIRFKTKLLVDINDGNGYVNRDLGDHFADIIADPVYAGYHTSAPIPWYYAAYPEGVKINSTATPDPKTHRFMAPNFSYGWDVFGGYFSWDFDLTATANLFDYSTTNGLYIDNLPFAVPDVTLYDSTASPSGHLRIKIHDSVTGNKMYDQVFANSIVLPYGTNTRFSGDGIDPILGYNPNIIEIHAADFISGLTRDYLRPANNTFEIRFSGGQARVEGVAIYQDDAYNAKYNFTTVENLTGLNTSYDINQIRNDVIVVGENRGSISDPNTGKVVNPNNPQLDYIYSRAIDVQSAENITSENSLGSKSVFLIYEPNIHTQRHADWLAQAALNRHRRVLNEISFKGLGIPFLDIDDPALVSDPSPLGSIENSLHWIEGYQEKISRGDYSIDYTTTPIPPWPSFQENPSIDLNKYKGTDDSRPNAFVNIKMDDQRGYVRNNDAAASGATSYDPYESEGSSEVSRSWASRTGEKVQLRLTYTQLVDGWVWVGVYSTHPGHRLKPAKSFIGGLDENGAVIKEWRSAGEYTFFWDAVDEEGATWDIADGDANSLIALSDYKGIYAQWANNNNNVNYDGKYYVVFEIDSSVPTDHDPSGYNLKKYYDSRYLPTTSSLGIQLNDSNYGESLYEAQVSMFWQLEIGSVATMTESSSPGEDSHRDSMPGMQTRSKYIYGFTSSDNGGLGFQTWLEGSNTAQKYRLVKMSKEIYSTTILIAPRSQHQILDATPIGGGATRYAIAAYGDAGSATKDKYLMDAGPNWDIAIATSPIRSNDGWTYPANAIRSLPHTAAAGAGVKASINSGYNGQAADHNGSDIIVTEHYPAQLLKREEPQETWKELRRGEATTIQFNPPGFFTGNNITYDSVPKRMWGDASGGFRTALASRPPIIPGQNSNYTIASYDTGNDGFKGFNILYASKYYTFAYNIYDRSGRRMSATAWDGKKARGLKPEDASYLPGNYVVTAFWIPETDQDITGSFKLPYAPNSPGPKASWLDSGGADNLMSQKISIPGYTDKGPRDKFPHYYASPASANTMEQYVIPIMLSDNPAGDVGYIMNHGPLIVPQTFHDEISSYMFWAWPIRVFWKPVPNDENWTTIRDNSSANPPGGGDTYYLGDPPVSSTE